MLLLGHWARRKASAAAVKAEGGEQRSDHSKFPYSASAEVSGSSALQGAAVAAAQSGLEAAAAGSAPSPLVCIGATDAGPVGDWRDERQLVEVDEDGGNFVLLVAPAK